ncbi:unnamed protein product [Phaeothamnion confervicola]
MGKFFQVKEPEFYEPLCRYVVDHYLPLSHIGSNSLRLSLQHQMMDGQAESITVDSWTSPANDTYFSVTRHFINNFWELLSLTADCIKHTGHTCTGDLVLVITEQLCGKYNIEPINIVTDCEPSMIAAGRDLPFDHTGCLAHRLDTVTGVWFKGPGVAATTKKNRELAMTFHSSSQLTDILKHTCELAGCPYRKIQQDVSTRWWSTYTMFESVLGLEKAITIMGGNDKLFKGAGRGRVNLAPTAAEWEIARQGATILEPFMVAQKMHAGGRPLCHRQPLDPAHLRPAGRPQGRPQDGERQDWCRGRRCCLAVDPRARSPRGRIRSLTTNSALGTASAPTRRGTGVSRGASPATRCLQRHLTLAQRSCTGSPRPSIMRCGTLSARPPRISCSQNMRRGAWLAAVAQEAAAVSAKALAAMMTAEAAPMGAVLQPIMAQVQRHSRKR